MLRSRKNYISLLSSEIFISRGTASRTAILEMANQISQFCNNSSETLENFHFHYVIPTSKPLRTSLSAAVRRTSSK